MYSLRSYSTPKPIAPPIFQHRLCLFDLEHVLHPEATRPDLDRYKNNYINEYIINLRPDWLKKRTPSSRGEDTPHPPILSAKVHYEYYSQKTIDTIITYVIIGFYVFFTAIAYIFTCITLMVILTKNTFATWTTT